MAHPFLERLKQGPILCDGAMGTMLYSHGISFEECFEALNLTNPELVSSIHRAYIEAGAEMIETNTYGANRLKLEPFGLADKVRQINHKALRIARDVREICGRPTLIAGAVGPLGVLLEPYGTFTLTEAEAIFAEQIGVLLEQGVDLLILETFGDLQEINAAINAAQRIGDLPIVAQMTFAEDGRTPMGNTPEEVVRSLMRRGVAVVGVNCSVGAQRVYRVLAEMREAAPEARLSALPNAGWPTERNNRVFYPSTPEYMATYARRFIEELGVNIVGGCCGTTPQHIAAMRTALDALDHRQDRPSTRIEIREHEPQVELAARPIAEPTLLAQKLEAGEFVISVEIDPPKGHNPQKCIEGARMLKEAGVQFINVADSPMARVRMSALAMCYLIQEYTGLETILHFTTRDRSLMGLQSDLLGAHAMNVRNILALKGDPPSLANYPGTTGVFDVDTIGLIRVIAGMNQGQDTAGNPIGSPTNFLIGTALNINADDPDWEIERLHKKVEAGAHFAMTQIAYDVDAWLAFRKRMGQPPIPIILGILPLQSYRQAEFLRNEVPGISPTDEALERMRRAGPDGRREGVKMAQELLQAARETVDGVYIMPSFGRYEISAEVLSVLA
ncbi:MAG: bifunctional homocysteine S-methyltransferase/methylenetetrahydrofolate reductase [Herpetosiphonaceae bacterium]|nr:MAG: bifunctional homocysteine S-methyltransferase/methylenetetrahydrofolate reductase [Herpetosiphonaceae bacterium]